VVGVIDGFRWAILGGDYVPYWPGFWASMGVTALMLVLGACVFRYTEKTFADVI
jgi:lipopolysaccharide transport system permease protein